MSALTRELVLFRLAVQFLTRLPVGDIAAFTPELLGAARRYFPAVGALVGGLGALGYVAAATVFPPSIAALAATAITLLATGAFHEDGLADTFDGFGGRDREAALAIMRDSRVGSYGMAALGLALAFKVAALASLPVAAAAGGLVSAHGLSRLSALLAARTSRYLRDGGAGELLRGGIGVGGSLLAGLTGLACFGVTAAVSIPAALTGLAGLALGHLFMRRLYEPRFGGHTGDTLGAVQQVSEVGFYLGVAVWL